MSIPLDVSTVEPFLYAMDLAGTLVFAISGILVARQNRVDVFGGAVIAFATAVGGGTIRDILIGSTPVGWMKDMNYLLAILAGVLIAIFFKKYINRLTKTLFLFDAIGIGLFTILGVQKTLTVGLSPAIAIMRGLVSAVFGGVLRDILVDRVPLIFRTEIYATACLFGAILYVILKSLGIDFPFGIVFSMLSIITLRILAVYYHWKLPKLK